MSSANIRQGVNSAISRFIAALVLEYDLDDASLRKKWEECSSEMPPVCKPCTKGTCPYVFSRGAKKGTTCGAKLRGSSEYCSKHRPPSAPKKKGIAFRRHRKFKTLFWNPSTGFVMREQTEGIIGKVKEKREGESEVKIGLSEADIKKCKELSLPYKIFDEGEEVSY